VLFHGFTASPRQLSKIAGYLFGQGWNVIVPRLPLHGYEDRMTTKLQALDMDMLFACGDETIAYARTFGSRLLIGGFSLGGALALWAAHRHAAERVVAIAPLFGVSLLPAFLQVPTARLALSLPNYFCWWNPISRERHGPPHGYPRLATHPIARALLFGQAFLKELETTTAPKTPLAILELNARDTAVHNGVARRVARAWGTHPDTQAFVHEIHGMPLSHDIVEPQCNGDLAAQAFPQVVRHFGNTL
jgi:pimeloyl-ACP methyl ester carboxylesterase